MPLNSQRNRIPIDGHHRRHAASRIFERMLPGQVIALVHDAVQRDARLLHRPDIARDMHQDQSPRRQVTESLPQGRFKGNPASCIRHRLLKNQRPGAQKHHAVRHHQHQTQPHCVPPYLRRKHRQQREQASGKERKRGQ